MKYKPNKLIYYKKYHMLHTYRWLVKLPSDEKVPSFGGVRASIVMIRTLLKGKK